LIKNRVYESYCERETDVDRPTCIRAHKERREKMGSVASEFSDLKYVFPLHVAMCVLLSPSPTWK